MHSIYRNNNLKQTEMKTEKVLNVVGLAWSAVLTLTVVAALVFIVYQLITGNYSGTAAREF